jgi:hypothetical protein
MNLENELGRALSRVAPSPRFASTVLDRIREETSSDDRFRQPVRAGWWSRMAVAALLVVSTGVLSSVYVIEVRREAAGEKAKQELVLAMQIASEKANLAKRQVGQIHRGIDEVKGETR